MREICIKGVKSIQHLHPLRDNYRHLFLWSMLMLSCKEIEDCLQRGPTLLENKVHPLTKKCHSEKLITILENLCARQDIVLKKLAERFMQFLKLRSIDILCHSNYRLEELEAQKAIA